MRAQAACLTVRQLPSHMIRFSQRGGIWVLGQSLLLAAVGLLALFSHGGGFLPEFMIAGMILMIGGAGIAFAGALALGGNLSVFPKPVERAQLVTHGIYALIRHPLYTSVIFMSIGWAMVWGSRPALLVSVLLVPFFHAKACREERWLRDRFPGYADYQRRVRRFIPCIL